jgi:hypothetical protein
MPRCYHDNHGLAKPTRFFEGEQGTGVGGDVVEEKNQASGAHERTAYALGFPEHAFPEHSPRGADLMVLFPFAPFVAIVLTARPKSQKARLRIGRIHELRFDDTLHGEIWPAHEVF